MELRDYGTNDYRAFVEGSKFPTDSIDEHVKSLNELREALEDPDFEGRVNHDYEVIKNKRTIIVRQYGSDRKVFVGGEGRTAFLRTIDNHVYDITGLDTETYVQMMDAMERDRS
jgi:hypothetical protein